MYHPLKTLGILGLTVAALVVTHGYARAEGACPATASVEALGDKNPGYTKNILGTTFTLVLTADNARVMSGTVDVQTDKGWFSIDVPKVELRLSQEQYSDDLGTFERDTYLSPAIPVRFPSSVHITYVFLKDVQAEGYPAVSCQSADDRAMVGPSAVKQPYLRNAVSAMTEHDTPIELPPGAPVLTPIPTQAPGSTSCTVPFADATMTQPYNVLPPNGNAPGRTIVAVEINASGGVDGATIWRPSGSRLYDSYAIYAAQHSQYSPKRAFCQAVPGVYYVLTDFKAKQ